MKNKTIVNNWYYFLLIIPVLSAIIALINGNFFFKSGSAGGGILILSILYRKKLLQDRSVWMIIAAFLFSIAGDWFLSHRNGDANRFIYGIALFFFAHLGYLFYSLLNGRIHWIATVVILLGFLLFFIVALYPHIDDKILMIAALIYLIISCFSLGAALGIKLPTGSKWLFVSGIILILFSDTIIALKEFAGYRMLDFLILPTYYLAHIGITISLMRRKSLTE